jgi:hypothetical protein
MEVVKVRMTRDAKAFPDSHEANVAPENVAEFEAMGWKTKKQRAAAEPVVEPVVEEVPPVEPVVQ